MSAPQAAYRIDGALVAPAEFYRVACDPRRSVVVEACAGAGKTWMLVSRILRALLAGAEPPQILAITFTRKAAGEMRERLQAWLEEFAHASQAQRIAALVQRGCDAAEAAALAAPLAGLQQRLLDAGRAVEIRTFHGWFSQLLRAAPMDLLNRLGLHADLELLEDRSDLQPQYWRGFLAAVAADADLRADHARLLRDHGRHMAQQWLEAALEQRVEIERADAAGTLAPSIAPAAALWPRYAGLATPAAALRAPALAASLARLAGDFAASGKSLQIEAARRLVDGLQLPDDEAAFEAVWSALHTKAGEPKKRMGDRADHAEACAALAEIRDAIAQQRAHETHARLVRLARALLAAYRDAKRARGLADMADLEHCAEQLLGDAACSGWIQERLDARLRHLLIDEFQDTSPLQWRTLDAWLSGYAGAGGGASGQHGLAVFIVGDPKQSIYRFRRADPRVFGQAREFVVQALDGAHLACDHTRRNAPAVLQALNAVFERAQAQAEFSDFRAHTTASDATGSVALLPVVPRPPRERSAGAAPAWRDSLNVPRIEAEEALRMVEARCVADEIAALLAEGGHRPADVMVLCRKREPLRHVAQALRERGIAHVAPEQRELAAAPEVQDLLALLDVLASPGHDLSLARALRSPVFGASDADLAALALAARATGGRTGWWTALLADASHDWRDRPALERARSLLPRWRGVAAALPPHDLLDRIVAEGEVRERYAAAVPATTRAAALAAIDALLGQALLQDGGRYATPYGLVRALRRERVLLPPPAESDAVQLLTIHGAKGLEARAVFVVDAMPQPPRPDAASLLIDWPADAHAPRCCAFVASESRCPPSLRRLLAQEQAGRAREEMNALYVAMTRAEASLVFSATEPHPAVPPGSTWQRLADAGVPVREARRPQPAAAADAGGAAAVLRVLPVLPARPAGAPAPAVETQDDAAARLGRAVHRVLEWLPAPAALAHAALAAAQEFGVAAGMAPRIEAIARAVLANPACRRFYDPAQLLWAGNEVPVVRQGEPLRIDRLLQLRDGAGEGEWWVLDYKLQHAPDAVQAYRAQLHGYREAVAALVRGGRVRAAFITGDGALLEL